jgi:hypothetical protein
MTRFLAMMLLGLFSQSGEAANNAPRSIEVFPKSIDLSSSRDRQGIIVLATAVDGSTQEVTAASEFTIDKPIAKVVNGEVAPLMDGNATISIRYQSQTVNLPVIVRHANQSDPLRFRTDVMPIFTKVGCNTGKCHGSASGKDGFRLSLFGYDPEGDHLRITREAGGRRINLASPEDCLLTNKATGRVSHTGGNRVESGSENEQILIRWLETGALKDPVEAPKPVGIEVFPKQAIFANKGGIQRLVIRAKYTDGTDRDVTRFTVFMSNNDASATVAESGLVTATGAGEGFILARFDEFTEGLPIIVRPGTAFKLAEADSRNEIDSLVLDKLNRMHISASPVCTDEVFIRRLYIDLIGALPTVEERAKFLTDRGLDKRERLIDSLLIRPEFRDIWVMKWAELLQIRTANGINPKGLRLYDNWLRKQIHQGATLDGILKQLLPAAGGTFENPAVNYFQTETSPQLMAENVAQVFLGTRVQCAQCHNHPFDRWTMTDYYGFAAFFSQIGYKIAQDPRELTIFNAGVGEMPHPIDGRPVSPKFLGGLAPELTPNRDYRATLADWLTSGSNEMFAKNFANIVWAHFFPKGIVDPVDDVRVSNPPSNPELLTMLGKRAIEYRFDVAKLVRDICLSQTYQRSTDRTPSNQWDERNFARQGVRRIRAEVLLDCISKVTETSDRFAGLPNGGRAVEIPDGRTPNYFLTTFGRSTRATACTCEVKTSPTLSQALHLLNGDTTNGKIKEGNVVDKLIGAGNSPTAIANELYLRCLGRSPTQIESDRIAKKIAAANDKKRALEDLFWALMNTNEFIFNR